MRTTVPTERCSIGVSETNRAFRMAKEGHSGPVHIFKHMGREGLQLRVQRNTAAWVVRYKDMSFTIGYLYPERSEMPLGGHTAALDLAADIKSVLIDQPERRDEYLLLRYRETTDAKGKTRRLTHGEALAALRPDASTWTFEQCIEQTIADKTSPDTPDKDRIDPSTVKDYRTTFNRPVWEDLKKTPAVLLDPADVERVRNAIRKDNGVSPAIKSITYTRAVLNWCAKNHSGESGLQKVTPWWQLLSTPYEVKAKTRKPSIRDIVASLILAEEYLDKPLPGRAISTSGVRPGTLAGLWWLVLTSQRATAGLSLLAHDIVADDNEEGWMLAAWAEDVMKTGQAFVLPVPERAWKHVDRFRERAKHRDSQDWAFPSEADEDKHVSTSGVYRILYRLAGKDALVPPPKEERAPRLKKDGTPRKTPERTERRDLLEEMAILWWSMHDVRRTLTDYLGEQGIPGGATVVLAHEVDEKERLAALASDREREEWLRQRTARITRMAYGGAQYLKLKKEAIRLWTDAVLDEYDRQKAQLTPVNEDA
jgi:hypothetical protein